MLSGHPNTLSQAADWLFTLVAAVSAIWAASHALLHNRDPRATWGWILSCWLLPIAGPLLYFAFGINRVQRRARRLRPAVLRSMPKPFAHAYSLLSPQLHPLAHIAEAVSGQLLLPGNSVEPLHNGEQAYPKMLAAIAAARHSVLLASYIFELDEIGKQFIAELAAAKARGVDVRVLIDGTADLGSARNSVATQLRLQQVAVEIFHPLTGIKRGLSLNLNLRNHRKLAIIDGVVAFTGGMNISAHSLAQKKDAAWVETDMHFALTGPIVGPLTEAFIEDWHYAGGSRRALPLETSAASSSLVAVSPEGTASCRVISDGPNEDFGHLVLVLIAAIAAARHRVQIMTPYFLPTRELITALHSAALRGIAVEVFLPAVSDHRVIHYASRHLLREMLERGVRVYYQAAPFSHSKLFVMDDSYALIGSANMDPRSLRLNFELNVEVYQARLAGQLHQHFDSVRASATPLTVSQLRKLPLWQRLRDAVCWLFSPYL